jgi:S1-C subfamily serine protease
MRTSIKIILLQTLLLIGLNKTVLLAKEQFDTKIIERAKKSVVTIHGQASLKAYEAFSNSWSGTGFIINKSKGYILTNAHIAGGAIIGTYHLFFHNGSRADAKLLYYDPWLDYAFMQIDPTLIPADATEIKITAKNPVMDQPVFIIGNNEGKSFSIHTGAITGLYEIQGAMPQHSIRLSLNTKGGSSGSPVINQQGEAIALNYGGSDTFGIGLHAAYLRYAIDFIEKGKIPTRKHMGAFTGTYSLNEAVKYRKFPVSELQNYNRKFPEALGNAIQVRRTLVGSPADDKLIAGDIIWTVNKQLIGPRLSELDLIMNNSNHNTVVLGIYRGGEYQEVTLSLYNLEDHKVKQMVSFGGTLFFKVDDSFSEKTGMPANTLTFSLIQGSNTFNNVFPYIMTDYGKQVILKVLAFDKTPIVSFEQLVEAIPTFIQQKYFTISYINYLPYRPHFGNWWYNIGINYYVADVSYDINTPEPKIFTFDDKEMEWKSSPVLLK